MNKLQLKFIGHLLFSERVFSRQSLQQISDLTCIRSDILKSIEKGDPPQELAMTYVRSFIKAYSKVLGVDVTSLIKTRVHYHTLEDEEGTSVPASGIPKMKVMLISGSTTLLLLLGAFIYFKMRPATEEAVVKAPPVETPTAAPENAKLAERPETDSNKEEASAEKTSPEKAQAKSGTPAKTFSLKALEDTWVILKDDNDKIFHNSLLKKGDAIDLEKEACKVTIENAGGVALSCDGQDSAPLGKEKAPLTNFKLTRENILELINKNK